MTLPWRATIAEWPIELRLRWGQIANQLEESGTARFPASEKQAFNQIRDEESDEPTREAINRFFNKV